MCWIGLDRTQWRLAVAEIEERMGRVFSAYGTPLTAVPSFKYLGRILSSTNIDWTLVDQNMQQDPVKWGEMVNTLGGERPDRRTAGRFYVATVQAVLLFGS